MNITKHSSIDYVLYMSNDDNRFYVGWRWNRKEMSLIIIVLKKIIFQDCECTEQENYNVVSSYKDCV